MKIIAITKKKFLFTTFLVVIGVISLFSFFNVSFGMQHYYKLDFSTGLVTASNLNVRSGPGTYYSVVTKVPKGQYIRVFAGVGDWYIVQVEGDYIGAVSKQYIKPIYPNSNNSGRN